MSIYVYALLVPTASPLVLPLGMERDIELVYSSGLAAIIEPEISLEAIQATDERLLQAVLNHDRVIRELFQQTPLLPLRFGRGCRKTAESSRKAARAISRSPNSASRQS